LTLKYDELLPTFAFKINLRRYITVRLKRATKLPAKRLARLKRPPFAVVKVGGKEHKSGPSTKVGRCS